MCGHLLFRPAVSITLLVLVWLAVAARALAVEPPGYRAPAPKKGASAVVLGDGETSAELDTPPGQPLPYAKAKAVADRLMAEWRKKNPDAAWDETLVAQARVPTPPGAAAGEARAAAPPVPSGHTYGAFGERDRLIWKASVDQLVEEGGRIFHDAKLLGGTTGISCDMCHPDAANTHPETYPKFQVQLGRVALLRDMINWCVENPVRGRPFADDSIQLRALEAFLLAQRQGVPLDYGKH